MEIQELKDKIYEFKSKFKYQLDEEELKVIKRAEDETFSDYEVDKDNYIRVSWLVGIIEDLLYHIKNLEEQNEELKNDIDTKYKLIDVDNYEYWED